MLLDSFYENRAPISKTRGVSRLNTRLGFYTYEIRKLKTWRRRSLVLLKAPHKAGCESLYRACQELELPQFEYVFKVRR